MPSLVKLVKSGRPVVAVDGCPLAQDIAADVVLPGAERALLQPV